MVKLHPPDFHLRIHINSVGLGEVAKRVRDEIAGGHHKHPQVADKENARIPVVGAVQKVR
jgi:hypothetical protein